MGSGAIGIEFASFYRTMGTDVTVIEVLPQILPVEDAEIAALARKRFEKQGIVILTSTKVTKVEKGEDSVAATIEDGKGHVQTIRAERLISAVGVVGNVEGLGLETLGVAMERGLVKTDPVGRTSVAGIYAIGDVCGPPMLAHKAEHEGTICVEAIAGRHPHAMDKAMIPGCTYCQPQVASVGFTEAKAREARARAEDRPLSVHRQRQGDRVGRVRRDGQDDLRCQDRQAARRAHGGGGGDRADPGLRRRHEPRDHGGGADGDRVPASDAERDDARERLGRLRAGDPQVVPATLSSPPPARGRRA